MEVVGNQFPDFLDCLIGAGRFHIQTASKSDAIFHEGKYPDPIKHLMGEGPRFAGSPLRANWRS